MTKILPKKETWVHLRVEGTTKYPYTHKHNPRHTARAFIVPIACV